MPIRPVEIMEKHTYDPDKDGIIALAQLVAEVCNNVDTDSKVAAEAAARVADVDAEETARIADVNAEETARINALNTHTELPAAHHAKTIDASELTAGILALARLAGITNTQIAAGAAIAYTKLALAGLIRNTDIKSDAAIAESKLALAQGTQALFDKIAADIATHAGLPTVHQNGPALIATHAGVAAAHHTKTIDASELTAGILALARLSGITNTQIAAGAAIAYTKLALAGKIKATDIEAAAGIPLSKLEGAVCSETEAAIIAAAAARTRAWLLDELVNDVIATTVLADLTNFQANPAIGDGTNPEYINNNSTADAWVAGTIGFTATVDFGIPVVIRRWRHWGHAGHNLDGEYTIQYYNLATLAWEDWVTGIATTDDNWSDMVTETPVITTGIRIVVVAVDTGTDNIIKELEVIY